jgi:predicted dehydrogenase
MLEAGKHVLIEKPIGVTRSEVDRIRQAVRGSDRVCMPSHNYIYAPEVQRIHAHLSSGRLGRLNSFWALYNQRLPPEIGSPDPAMGGLTVHHIYALLYFAGRPDHVSATGSNVHFNNPQAIDQIIITAGYANGTIANLWASFSTDDWSRDPWTVKFKVFGARGTGVASWDQIKIDDEPGAGQDDAAYWDGFLYTQLHFLNDCIQGGGTPLSTVDDAYDAACVIEAADKSLQSGNRVRVDYGD